LYGKGLSRENRLAVTIRRIDSFELKRGIGPKSRDHDG